MLFDNSEQLEVRHVIALAHYDLDVFGGGQEIPEGELWIKRNCIRLTRKRSVPDITSNSMPFYLFSDNCSDKEDFWHALLHNQESKSEGSVDLPKSQLFDTEDMIKLIRQIHLSEENSQTRCLNALIGRVFLSLYKTSHIEDFVRMKITKKMARAAKPVFVKSLGLEKIEMGNSAPNFSNLKLKEMTVDGALTIEADMRYTGNFKLVIAAMARIELGSRFKPREVNLLLAGIFKKVEGHVLLRIKPPPSNRIWMSFETIPKIEMSIEPVVSSRQITYGVILRAIESRVREVIADTIVLPNWDDIPFTNTQHQRYRGGIWEDDDKHKTFSSSNDADDHYDPIDSMEGHSDTEADTTNSSPSSLKHETTSVPDLIDDPPAIIKDRQSANLTPTKGRPTGSHSSHQEHAVPGSAEKPKAMRSNSFAAVAVPIVSKGPATINANSHQPKKRQNDAASAMKVLSSRPQDPSSPVPPTARLTPEEARVKVARNSLASTIEADHIEPVRLGRFREDLPHELDTAPLSMKNMDGLTERQQTPDPSLSPSRSKPGGNIARSAPVRSLQKALPLEKRIAINHSIVSATTAAKTWGWGVLGRPGEAQTDGSNDYRISSITLGQPIGRGQPLPPPGTPLPKPEKPGWSASALNSLRRKPVAPPALPARPVHGSEAFFSPSPSQPHHVADSRTDVNEQANALDNETGMEDAANEHKTSDPTGQEYIDFSDVTNPSRDGAKIAGSLTNVEALDSSSDTVPDGEAQQKEEMNDHGANNVLMSRSSSSSEDGYDASQDVSASTGKHDQTAVNTASRGASGG